MADLEFIQRCVNDDAGAWDEFLKRYSRLIYNYVHNVLTARGYAFTQSHSSDIFQEIFSSLLKDNCKKLKSFKGRNGCSLATWLRQVTINFTIDYLRKVRPALSLDEEREDGRGLKDILADSAPDIPDTLHREERLKTLKECIENLSKDDKFFLELHIYRSVKLERLKGFFKISRGAIDMWKARLLNKLRDCFRGKGFALDF